MSLTSCSEGRFDAEIDLEHALLEPAPATTREIARRRGLADAEHAGVKRSASGLDRGGIADCPWSVPRTRTCQCCRSANGARFVRLLAP